MLVVSMIIFICLIILNDHNIIHGGRHIIMLIVRSPRHRSFSDINFVNRIHVITRLCTPVLVGFIITMPGTILSVMTTHVPNMAMFGIM